MVREALAAAADAPAYPQTYGTERLREAAALWLSRRFGVAGLEPSAVLPTIGSKEVVALLPSLLGCRGRVTYPALAYPTYEVGATFAGCEHGVGTDGDLVWLNSPANPDGRVMTAAEMREVVDAARARGAIVASDECYLELGWDAEPVSVLHPDVCGGSHEGLLALHSLSKRSNMAGYRAAFVAGDPALVRALLHVRKHDGLIVPAPVQAAMLAALDDDQHVEEQRERYRRRREVLRRGLEAARFTIERSHGGLYLWATRGESCWDSVAYLADLGILAGPGEFYGAAGTQHVRIALTVTDERAAAAAARLGA